jgi:hypothetical protein
VGEGGGLEAWTTVTEHAMSMCSNLAMDRVGRIDLPTLDGLLCLNCRVNAADVCTTQAFKASMPMSEIVRALEVCPLSSTYGRGGWWVMPMLFGAPRVRPVGRFKVLPVETRRRLETLGRAVPSRDSRRYRSTYLSMGIVRSGTRNGLCSPPRAAANSAARRCKAAGRRCKTASEPSNFEGLRISQPSRMQKAIVDRRPIKTSHSLSQIWGRCLHARPATLAPEPCGCDLAILHVRFAFLDLRSQVCYYKLQQPPATPLCSEPGRRATQVQVRVRAAAHRRMLPTQAQGMLHEENRGMEAHVQGMAPGH